MKNHLLATSSLLLAIAVSALAACAPQEGEEADDSTAFVSNDPLDQGWSEDQVSLYEHASDGSGLFPYKWLVALEQADSKNMFLEDANVRKYGFIPDPKNPDKLPVGLAKQENVKNSDAMVGSTCSSCHEGEITYKGTTLRIHGGQGAADITGFTLGAYDALQATLKNPLKFRRFAKRVDGNADIKEFFSAVKKILTLKLKLFVQERELKGTQSTENGPYRADAFGIGVNRLVGPIKKDNLRPTKSSASLQHLWGTHLLDWAQYNGSIRQPMARNVISALGRGATVELKTEEGKPGLANTVNVKNLYAVEETLKELRAPKWPEKVFGAIDAEKAARGKNLYYATRDGASCGTCHDLQKNEDGLFRTTIIPLAQIGTDPENAKAFDRTVDLDGKLGKGVIPVSEFLTIATQGVMDRDYFDMKASREDVQKMNGFRENDYRSAAGYRPRSLDGVWATAPLLHNGSVPSLYELLKPESKRVKKFKLGSKEMDPKNVGLVTEGDFTFDTSIDGNHNTGHSGAKFGTELSEGERWDLVEYLKTL